MPEVLEAQQMITFDVPGEYRHWRLRSMAARDAGHGRE